MTRYFLCCSKSSAILDYDCTQVALFDSGIGYVADDKFYDWYNKEHGFQCIAMLSDSELNIEKLRGSTYIQELPEKELRDIINVIDMPLLKMVRVNVSIYVHVHYRILGNTRDWIIEHYA